MAPTNVLDQVDGNYTLYLKQGDLWYNDAVWVNSPMKALGYRKDQYNELFQICLKYINSEIWCYPDNGWAFCVYRNNKE